MSAATLKEWKRDKMEKDDYLKRSFCYSGHPYGTRAVTRALIGGGG